MVAQGRLGDDGHGFVGGGTGCFCWLWIFFLIIVFVILSGSGWGSRDCGYSSVSGSGFQLNGDLDSSWNLIFLFIIIFVLCSCCWCCWRRCLCWRCWCRCFCWRCLCRCFYRYCHRLLLLLRLFLIIVFILCFRSLYFGCLIRFIIILCILTLLAQLLLFEPNRLKIVTLVEVNYAPLQFFKHQIVLIFGVNTQKTTQIFMGLFAFFYFVALQFFEEFRG